MEMYVKINVHIFRIRNLNQRFENEIVYES